MFLYKGNLTHGLLEPQVVIKYPQSSIYYMQNTVENKNLKMSQNYSMYNVSK